MSETSARDIWEKALGALQVQVTRSIYDTWLHGSVGLAYRGEAFTIGVPTPFAAEWLERRMLPLVERTLMDILKHPVSPLIQVAETDPSPAPKISPGTANGPASPSLPHRNLNPRYTFNSFVVGDSNRLAYSAALAVAQAPGESYNPLFVHADVGMGKTHLLQAIGHVTAAHGYSTMATSSEQYVTDFITSLRDHKEAAFRTKYRTPDLLLMDDIQFLSGKAHSEESFFHLFNALHETNHQIVVTSDRPPDALSHLQRRLTSRFQWGLQVVITLPSVETRYAILQQKAIARSIELADDILSFLAAIPLNNIRTLEGLLNRVIAYLSFTHQAPSLRAARAALDAPGDAPSPKERAERIVALIADYYGLPPKTLTGPSREAPVSQARQMAMYLLHHHAALTPKAIAPYLGGRHPKTIQHGIEKITRIQETDSTIQHDLNLLLQSISLP